MKILVLFTFDYSLKSWNDSGTLSRELSIYKELNKKNDATFVFLTYGDSTDHTFNLGSQGFEVIPIYEEFKKSSYKVINYIKSFYVPFYYKKRLMHVDLIKQNQLLGSWTAVLFKFLLNKPLFIRTGYDMYNFSILDKKSKLLQTMYKLLTKFSLYFANLYSVTSESDLVFLKKNFKKTSKVIKRSNWVINSKYKPFESRYSNKILAIGRLEYQKNFKVLIEAFSNSDFEIDLIGSGSLKPKLQNVSDRLNCKINFLDNMNFEDLHKLMSSYKYFITTSIFEGNPKSLLDAMSSGCVCYASNISNHAELISHDINGYLFDNNQVQLKEVFYSNLNNQKYLKEISKNTYNQINITNSLTTLANNEFEDYKSLI